VITTTQSELSELQSSVLLLLTGGGATRISEEDDVSVSEDLTESTGKITRCNGTASHYTICPLPIKPKKKCIITKLTMTARGQLLVGSRHHGRKHEVSGDIWRWQCCNNNTQGR